MGDTRATKSVLLETLEAEEEAAEAISPTAKEMVETSENTSTTTGATWHEPRSNISAKWCLIDHPELWSKLGREADFRKSKRLMSLMGQPKNEIIRLPDAAAVARQFRCAACDEIPFPWEGNPNIKKFQYENETYKEGVHLCEKGHTVCRTCFENCFSCAASTDKVPCNTTNTTALSVSQKNLSSCSGSMGSWGMTRLCLAPITPNVCQFLTDMIRSTEFACQNFYNWCDFRGRGKDLVEHERNCPFRPPTSQPDSSQLQSTSAAHSSLEQSEQAQNIKGKIEDDDDDAKILTLEQDVIISETNELLQKLIPNWDQINPRNKVKTSKRQRSKRFK